MRAAKNPGAVKHTDDCLRSEAFAQRQVASQGAIIFGPGILNRRALLSVRTLVGEWLSLVEHLVRDQGVGGSNPLSPTISKSLAILHLRNRGMVRHLLDPSI